MTEDISAQICLAVTVNVLAALTATVLTIFTVMNSWLNEFRGKMIISFQNPQVTTTMEVVNQKWVSAAEAFKFIESIEGRISAVNITLYERENPDNVHEVTGTITSGDKTVLLKHAYANVTVNVIDEGQGMYRITVEEVE